MKDIVGEVISTPDEAWPFRVVLKSRNKVIAFQEAKTQSSAEKILKAQMRDLRIASELTRRK